MKRLGLFALGVALSLPSASVAGRAPLPAPAGDDSAMVWCGFLGGIRDEDAMDVVVDAVGDVFVCGLTLSPDFPVTAGAFDTEFDALTDQEGDGFVAKISPDGSHIIWCTFVGGERTDFIKSMDVLPSGSLVLTGYTSSVDFPIRGSAYDPSYNGGGDAFIAILSADGDSLLASTFVGGEGQDEALALALDTQARISITGQTSSNDFPTTLNAWDRGPIYEGPQPHTDAFVLRVSSNLGQLIWSTFLGGDIHDEHGQGIAVDDNDEVVVAGFTGSSDFPITGGAFDTTFAGIPESHVAEGFVTRLDAAGSSLVWSSFVGGESNDIVEGVVLDQSGRAIVLGYTSSEDFPVTPGVLDPLFDGGESFLLKVEQGGGSIVFSTFLGWLGSEDGYDVGIGPNESIVAVGGTFGSAFPSTLGYCSPCSLRNAIVTHVDRNGASLLDNILIGGPESDEAFAVSVDGMGDALVIGSTRSPTFPVTPEAADTSFAGGIDAFITRLDLKDPTTSTTPISGERADGLVLLPTRPDPAREFVELEFLAENREQARLTVHDASGRLVATLFEGVVDAGRHSTRWLRRDAFGRRVASGVYYLRLETAASTTGGSVTLLP